MQATDTRGLHLSSEAEIKDELRELTRLSGLNLREEVFDVLVELTRLDVVPTAISQVLKSLCSKARANQSKAANASA